MRELFPEAVADPDVSQLYAYPAGDRTWVRANMVASVDGAAAVDGRSGGLSGPAVRPIAVRCVWMVREALPDVPIIGCGGVRTGRDALEFLLAGASMVAVGTVLFHDPSACSRIQRELEEELTARGVDRVSDVIGRAHQPAVYGTERHTWG